MSLSSADLIDIVDGTIERLHGDHRAQLIGRSNIDEDILQIRWKGEFVIHRHRWRDEELPLDTGPEERRVLSFSLG